MSRPAPSGVGGGGCGELGQGELECVRPDGSEERILMPKLRPTPRPPALSPEIEEIPVGVRRLAAWSWRLIVIVAASALLLRSEEHTSELQSRGQLGCRLLLEKKIRRGARASSRHSHSRHH